MVGVLRPAYTDGQLNGRLSISYSCPVLYRFMSDEHIGDFLSKGILRISTLRQCKTLKDAIRRDTSEAAYQYNLQWADCFTDLNATLGENAFVLCCSLTQYAIHECSCSSCLEIHHWQELALEIGEQLRHQGFPIAEVIVGPCNYAAKRRTIDMRPRKYSDVCCPDGKVDSGKLSRILVCLGHEAFYMTKSIDYAEEYEYRFIWLSSEKIKEDYAFVTIKHPERFGCKIPALGRVYENE